MTSPSLRESVLAFMTSNPTAWRIKAVAAKLGVGVQRMGFELSQLNAEGKLVSCTVKAPGRQPEEEYRIAATEQRVDPHHFVISRKTNVRLRAPAERESSLARGRADDAVREVLHGEEHQIFFGKRLDRVHDVGGSVDQCPGCGERLRLAAHRDARPALENIGPLLVRVRMRAGAGAAPDGGQSDLHALALDHQPFGGGVALADGHPG